uniref:NACHT domain-containing protein n=1 Tax=Erpetoichthys calabaricus TaxID=27687 RepID=A0A8C4ST90_ERPCA
MSPQGLRIEYMQVWLFGDSRLSQCKWLLWWTNLLSRAGSCYVQEEQEKFKEAQARLHQGYNPKMRSEISRLKSFENLKSYSSCSPSERAKGGFYCTEDGSYMQCFCCGFVLLGTPQDKTPYICHQEFQPNCDFIKGLEVGNIPKYEVRVQQNIDIDLDKVQVYSIEEKRVESYKDWPNYSKADLIRLARAGFYFTGKCLVIKAWLGWDPGWDGWMDGSLPGWEDVIMEGVKGDFPLGPCLFHIDSVMLVFFSPPVGVRDTVQCHCCGGTLSHWEQEDDPWKEHAKWFPEPHLDFLCNFHLFTYFFFCFFFPVTRPENEWLHDAKRLCSSLRDVYNTSAFRNMAQFSDCATVSIDLKHIFAWVPMVMKNINNQLMQKVSLPILLKNLSYITMIEGAAGSGKSALLRKIAILWASGHCPVLQRFKLVFYLSFTGLQKGQNLSDMIAKQLGMAQVCLSEELIRESIRKLNNQVLFLLDDCGVTDLIPHCIEDLMLQNHINKVDMVIGIQTHRSARVRQYASRILEMGPFPFYSTFYILRKVFSHSIVLVELFFVELGLSLLLQQILKTPRMAIIICDLWIQNPNPRIETRNIFEAYLHRCVRKYPYETEKLEKLASCLGDLALEGVFSNRVDFDRADLEQTGIDENKALCTGLLDKCTAQMLRPVYKFFHFHFQEFVAGRRLGELLQSESVESQNKGLHYLKQMDTFLKVMCSYKLFLEYTCMFSPGVAVKIISHILSHADKKGFYDSKNDSSKVSKNYLDVCLSQTLLTGLFPSTFLEDSAIFSNLLKYILNLVYIAKSADAAAPHILKALTGKSLCYLHHFFLDYPEALSVLREFKVNIKGERMMKTLEYSGMEDTFSFLGRPVVNEELSAAYAYTNSYIQELKSKVGNINKFLMNKKTGLSGQNLHIFSRMSNKYKIPMLNLEVGNTEQLEEDDLNTLLAIFAVTEQVKLTLEDSNGFLESNQSAINMYRGIFREITIFCHHLRRKEEELIISMPFLESLQLTFTEVPGTMQKYIFNHPLLLYLFLEMIFFVCFFLIIASFIQHFIKLKCFHLKCNWSVNFSPIVESLASCEDMESLCIEDRAFYPDDVSALGMYCWHFILLVSRVIVENICILLAGTGNCIYNINPDCDGKFMPVFGYHDTWSKIAKEGHLQALQQLNLNVNHDITDSGWRSFFLNLDKVPHLATLLVSRMYTHNLKPSASTMMAFVQCASRLPSLLTVNMSGWLLDTEDVQLFETMKKEHPQAKCLSLNWKWLVPVLPIIKEDTF